MAEEETAMEVRNKVGNTLAKIIRGKIREHKKSGCQVMAVIGEQAFKVVGG